MSTLQEAINNNSENQDDHDGDEHIRDIHALTPPRPPAFNRRLSDTGIHRSSSSEAASSENFTTVSREFRALVLAGNSLMNRDSDAMRTLNNHNDNNQLTRIGENEQQETNPIAIVPDNHPLDQGISDQQRRVGPGEPPALGATAGSSSGGHGHGHGETSVLRVKKEEVESKICAWQNAKVAKINSRFKREDAIINGWENEQVRKATSRMKKVERKLEEKRARALEKMENEVAKAHRKAEEKRASAEGNRGTRVAKVHEIADLMRVVGRPPAKRSFF